MYYLQCHRGFAEGSSETKAIERIDDSNVCKHASLISQGQSKCDRKAIRLGWCLYYHMIIVSFSVCLRVASLSLSLSLSLS